MPDWSESSDCAQPEGSLPTESDNSPGSSLKQSTVPIITRRSGKKAKGQRDSGPKQGSSLSWPPPSKPIRSATIPQTTLVKTDDGRVYTLDGKSLSALLFEKDGSNGRLNIFTKGTNLRNWTMDTQKDSFLSATEHRIDRARRFEYSIEGEFQDDFNVRSNDPFILKFEIDGTDVPVGQASKSQSGGKSIAEIGHDEGEMLSGARSRRQQRGLRPSTVDLRGYDPIAFVEDLPVVIGKGKGGVTKEGSVATDGNVPKSHSELGWSDWHSTSHGKKRPKSSTADTKEAGHSAPANPFNLLDDQEA